MKRWSLIVTGVLLLLTTESAVGQLLFKSGMEPENYGRSGYYKYGRSLINRQANPKYDSFGNYIMDGVRAFAWEEEKINSRHTDSKERFSRLYKTNEIDEGEYLRDYLNNLVVVHEEQKAFQTRFIVGNEIRVNFSPLTLDLAAMNGIRWDFNFSETNLSFISSRADLPLWFSRDYVNPDLRFRLNPVYLTGGHIQKKVGIFNIAANYVNAYKSDSSRSRSNNSITGTNPWNPNSILTTGNNPMIVVKLEDGSRWDAGGPRLIDIYPTINGVVRKDLLVGITTGSWSRDFSQVSDNQNNPAKDLYVNRYFLDPKRIPQYVKFDKASSSNLREGASPFNLQFLMKRDGITQGWSTPNEIAKRNRATNLIDRFRDMFATWYDFQDNKKYLEANGEEYIQFWFQLPDKSEVSVSDVEFRSLVGNDYKFSIAEIYKDSNNIATGKNATYFYTACESPGNVKDMSNLKLVRFTYGQQTANMIMGLHIDANVKDFEMVAEYNRNFTYRQYFHPDADKFRTDSDAYYLNVKKTFGKLAFGGELFKLDPQYATAFENVDPSYYAMNVVQLSSWNEEFHNDAALQGGTAGSSDAPGYMANTKIIEFVDDNDDKDRYPDFHMYSQVRDRNGIYPGLDTNGNNRPDTNENDNLIPDYAEPFLLYGVDPDSYDYGDDYNNNGVIDSREDDDRPDYPYNIDTKGYHLFTSFGEETGTKYTVGYMNMDEIWGGGETDVRYGKIEYKKFIPFFADLTVNTQLKKVKDTIMDDVFGHERSLSTTLIDSFSFVDNPFYGREGIQHDFLYDQLKYRDSWVSTSYFDTKIFRVPNLTVGIKVKYDLNHQNENSFQNKHNIIERTQVFRADYRYYFKDLLLMPQVKFMARKLTSTNEMYRPFHEQYFYPIIRAEYPLTFKTTLKAGMQGFPGLNSTARNLVNSQLDYDERHYLIMLSNNSLYQGYDFSLNFGYEVNWQKFYGIMREPYNKSDKIIFIRLIVGMEPIS